MTEHMERYMQRLEKVDSNIIPLYLAESYFNLGNTGKAFEMLNKYLDYVASDQDAWNRAFQLLVLHNTNSSEFKDGVLQIYAKLQLWNEEHMGTLQVTPEMASLVNSILEERSAAS